MFVTRFRSSGKLRGSVNNCWYNDPLERGLSEVDLDECLPRFLGRLALGIVAEKK